MCSRYKVLGLLSIAVAALTISLNPVQAAGWEKQALPLPSYTEKVKEEVRRIAAAEFDFSYYTSTQAPEKLKEFYRATLANLGWKESEPLKNLQEMPDFFADPVLTRTLKQNLLFEKEGLLLVINFLPEGFFPDQKTRFTLAQGKIGLESAPAEDTIPPLELLAKPQKEVAPVYPGAALISLSEPADALTAAYFTPDDINAVAIFYKTQMPNYAWSLVEEKAPQKLEMPQVSQEDIARLCPACAQQVAISAPSMESWMAQLSFVNSRQDTCNIILSRVISAEAGGAKMEMTTILVNYAEKKR